MYVSLFAFFISIVFAFPFFMLWPLLTNTQKNKKLYKILSCLSLIITLCSAVYILKYGQKMESITETIVSSTIDKEILYFCNIPVQKISGNISGSSFFGTGEISGNIATTEELTYWYKNNDGKYIYASVNPNDSKIVPLQEESKPFLRIITYTTQEILKDNNIGEEIVTYKNSYKKYEFHLPIEFIQYKLG